MNNNLYLSWLHLSERGKIIVYFRNWFLLSIITAYPYFTIKEGALDNFSTIFYCRYNLEQSSMLIEIIKRTNSITCKEHSKLPLA